MTADVVKEGLGYFALGAFLFVWLAAFLSD